MIGFLQDPTLLETVARLLGKMKDPAADCAWFALVDTAFDYQDGGFKLFSSSHTNCYGQNPSLDSLLPAAPCLVALDPAKQVEQMRELVEHCDARPMLSFLAVKKGMSGEDLAKQWNGLHWAEEPDGDRSLLRFADTRSLAHLPEILKPGQWQAWHQNVTAWYYIDRTGALAGLPLPKADEPPPKKTKLDDGQFARFLELTEPDTVLELIHQHAPDSLPAGNTGSPLYELAERSTRKIRHAGIDDMGDSALLLVSVLETEGKLLEAPELDSFLQARQWKTGGLYEALMKEDWFKAI